MPTEQWVNFTAEFPSKLDHMDSNPSRRTLVLPVEKAHQIADWYRQTGWTVTLTPFRR